MMRNSNSDGWSINTRGEEGALYPSSSARMHYLNPLALSAHGLRHSYLKLASIDALLVVRQVVPSTHAFNRLAVEPLFRLR